VYGDVACQVSADFLAASRLAKTDLWILRGVVLLLRALLLVVDGLVC